MALERTDFLNNSKMFVHSFMKYSWVLCIYWTMLASGDLIMNKRCTALVLIKLVVWKGRQTLSKPLQCAGWGKSTFTVVSTQNSLFLCYYLLIIVFPYKQLQTYVCLPLHKGKSCEWRSISMRCYGWTRDLFLVCVLEPFWGGLRTEDEEW